MSGEAGFTAPHAVNEAEVGFDLKARRHGVCKFFNSQKGFGYVPLDRVVGMQILDVGLCSFINDDHPEELGHQEGPSISAAMYARSSRLMVLCSLRALQRHLRQGWLPVSGRGTLT